MVMRSMDGVLLLATHTLILVVGPKRNSTKVIAWNCGRRGGESADGRPRTRERPSFGML